MPNVATESDHPDYPGKSGFHPRHTFIPDQDQNYLVIVHNDNCNEKIDTL